MESIKKQYEAKLDSKKRIIIRGAETKYYKVTEKKDGTVILSPRVLVHPDGISKRSLEMIKESMENFKEGKVSEPVDLDELKEFLKE